MSRKYKTMIDELDLEIIELIRKMDIHTVHIV
jgi:hypothetical protein